MEYKVIKHGTHIPGNDTEGYMYNFNTSKGYNMNPHTHTCYEFIYVLRGTFLYSVEDKEYKVSDGDFIMANPNEIHSVAFLDGGDYQRAFLHIYPGFVERFDEILKMLDSREKGYFNHIPKKLVLKYGIDKIFTNIEECCKEPYEETDLLVLTYFFQLVLIINKILREEEAVNMYASHYGARIRNKKINVICKYISEHYNENITVEDIAGAAFISPSYASRMFKKEMGITIKAYLNVRRVTRAKNLLLEGIQATDVIYECGFKDYSTFYRSFVKYTGMTPEQFKNIEKTKEQ